MSQDKKGLLQLTRHTIVAYVRMASTVVIAVVVRICLDCVGIILTGQEPTEASFWFAHCRGDGGCVLAGIVLFFVSLAGCSAFAWGCQDWITDPSRNPYARRFSFEIVVEAAGWIPISVVVGKTNAIVEWFMDIAKDNRRAAPVLSSAVAMLLTLSCALLTHLAMKHCNGVQRSAQVKEAGWTGFGKFFLLATLYCLGWAVGWSNWELVLSLMDAIEPGQPLHRPVLAGTIIFPFLFICTCFYLRYGPEPIIPDPRLQQLCYHHGYSNSVRRSLVSYVVYSCVVFVVMCCCDPTYGVLILLAEKVYTSISSVFDARALCVLCAVASVVTLLAAVASAAISWAMDVDEFSSMKLSRSVHHSCQRMVTRSRSDFDNRLMRVLEDGSDVRFVEARELELRDRAHGPLLPPSGEALDEADDASQDDYLDDGYADESGGPSKQQSPAYRPPIDLVEQEVVDLSPGSHVRTELASERQLRLNPRAISKTLCASVLVYDVLGLVVCFQWGMIAVRIYSVVFGHLAAMHDALYALSCLVYAMAVVGGLSRFVFAYFPSAQELDCRDPNISPMINDPIEAADASFFVRLLGP